MDGKQNKSWRPFLGVEPRCEFAVSGIVACENSMNRCLCILISGLVALTALVGCQCGSDGISGNAYRFGPAFPPGVVFRANSSLYRKASPSPNMKDLMPNPEEFELGLVYFGRTAPGAGVGTRILEVDSFDANDALLGADRMDRNSYLGMPYSSRIALGGFTGIDSPGVGQSRPSRNGPFPGDGSKTEGEDLVLLSHMAILPPTPVRVGEEWLGRLPMAILELDSVKYERKEAARCRLAKVETTGGRRIATISYEGGTRAPETSWQGKRWFWYEGTVRYDLDGGMPIAHDYEAIIKTSLGTWVSKFTTVVSWSPATQASPADVKAEESRAMFRQGEIYRNGIDVPRDFAKAMECYRKSAEGGNAAAMFCIGQMYREGSGIPQDNAVAAEWFTKAAQKGHLGGMECIGLMYATGQGITRDYREALHWWRMAASGGSAEAMYRLGTMYQGGTGVSQTDQEAVNWYRKAAAKGHKRAVYELGLINLEGWGVPRNPGEGERLVRMAAEGGIPEAMNSLGVLYNFDPDIPPDPAEAAKWFRRAAEAGDPEGMCNLGLLHEHGRGVAKDTAEAIKWYRKAAAHGVRFAKDALKRLEGE
ncbi:MAG: tetratricopeptide repeat protein [Planctomycetota bacterium]|nr:tetratricopeptide repeat protein [Planctomycetota bacterium]